MSIVGIVLFGSEMTAESWSNLIGLLIGLNIMLGVLNLIPLLPFDGGPRGHRGLREGPEMRRRQDPSLPRRRPATVAGGLRRGHGARLLFVAAMYLDVTQGVSL